MAKAVIMPKAGITVESCIIGEWKKKIGDAVKVGDILFDYETDKAAFECESTEEGELLEIFFDNGEEVPVLVNVCAIGTKGDDVSALRPEGAETAAAPVAEEKPEEAAPAAEGSATATEVLINGTPTMVELAESFYIDWGSLINAIINFLIIAFVLFCIVKVMNNLKEGSAKLKAGKYTKEQRAELKAAGIKRQDKAACEAFFAEKAKAEAEAKAKADAEAAEAARIAAENSTEALLKQIRDLLASK